MDTPAFIVSHWQNEQKTFRKNLEIIKEQPAKEAIHDIRVSVKKLRAILELYILVSGETLMDNPINKAEELFSVTGRQRDIDICLERLETCIADSGFQFPELSAFLESMLKKANQWTAIAVSQYNDDETGRIKVLLKNEEALLANEGTVHKASAIITAKLPDSHHLLRQPHQLRQHLKKILYWVRMLPGELPVIFHEKELHEITDDLGLWQDNEIFQARIRHFRKDYLPKTYDEYGQLRTLAIEVRKENKLLLGKALRKTRKLLKTSALKEKEKALS